jgi:ADP-dependent NAD(P)H-hydrate dehydratase / NAD(P)H-hydrate epimerase
MPLDYWLKQTKAEALFPDLLWSRPENKTRAGKLLIIGGNRYGFVEPSDAYRSAESAGIGTVRMILPDSLKQFVGKNFAAGELAPSTPSGSLSQRALEVMLRESNWSDGVLLTGGLGRNSETAILLEKFTDKFTGQLTITKDAADYFVVSPGKILSRPNTLLVISFAQLQKLASSAKFSHAFTFSMDLIHLVNVLHDLTEAYKTFIIVKHLDYILVGVNGRVSSSMLAEPKDSWRVLSSAFAATWWLQNPTKPFEALTCAIFEFNDSIKSPEG